MREINTKQLAIVIPAYKGHFLEQVLESIAAQTDQRFNVYIGDDASPHDIKRICDAFSHRLDLSYTKFDENIGQKSLVSHWNRCIDLSTEPWIWLFCDDDLMESQCLEMFYKTIEKKGNTHDVLRFNTLTIDDSNRVIRINPPHPLTETGPEFIYHRLKRERASFVSEYIFSRKSYIENRGIVDFPLAWCSDDASWLKFSKNNKILTIQDGRVLWRHGEYNISPSRRKYQSEKIEAAFSYIKWLNKFLSNNEIDDSYLNEEIKKLSKIWFLNQIKAVMPLTYSNYIKSMRYINTINRKKKFKYYFYILFNNIKYQLCNFKIF